MTVTFISNYLNHHQLSLCQSFIKLTNNHFFFVANMKTPQVRIDFGYEDMNNQYPFVVRAYESETEKEKAINLARTSDILIFGGTDEQFFIQERMKNNLLTFMYSERLFKRSYLFAFSPRSIYLNIAQYTVYRKKRLYLLAAGAYVTRDYAVSGAFIGKTYKWGYFPEIEKRDINSVLKNKKKKSILWCGRLISWKHPEYAVMVAKKLRKEGYVFSLDILGDGELSEKLKEDIAQENLSNCVNLLGSVPHGDVKYYMDRNAVFLFTSDRNEGWGAVLNEAMSSGCAVIANNAIGSANYLLKNGENGYVYRSFNQLYQFVKKLLDFPEHCSHLGEEAYKTVSEVWNAEEAASRLLQLSNSLTENKGTPYEDGPCSRA